MVISEVVVVCAETDVWEVAWANEERNRKAIRKNLRCIFNGVLVQVLRIVRCFVKKVRAKVY
jgi:hypothetical protein